MSVMAPSTMYDHTRENWSSSTVPLNGNSPALQEDVPGQLCAVLSDEHVEIGRARHGPFPPDVPLSGDIRKSQERRGRQQATGEQASDEASHDCDYRTTARSGDARVDPALSESIHAE